MTKKPIILAGSKRFCETLENSRDVEKDIETLDSVKQLRSLGVIQGKQEDNLVLKKEDIDSDSGLVILARVLNIQKMLEQQEVVVSKWEIRRSLEL